MHSTVVVKSVFFLPPHVYIYIYIYISIAYLYIRSLAYAAPLFSEVTTVQRFWPVHFQKWRQFNVFEWGVRPAPLGPPKNSMFFHGFASSKNRIWGAQQGLRPHPRWPLQKHTIYKVCCTLPSFYHHKINVLLQNHSFYYVSTVFCSKSWFYRVNHLLIFHRFPDFHHSKTMGFSMFCWPDPSKTNGFSRFQHLELSESLKNLRNFNVLSSGAFRILQKPMVFEGLSTGNF